MIFRLRETPTLTETARSRKRQPPASPVSGCFQPHLDDSELFKDLQAGSKAV